MNQNQTLQTLEDIIHLIRTLDNANDADDSMDIKMRLKNLINDAHEDRIISDDMYNAYDELFQTELRTGFLNVEALYNITVKNYEKVKGANDKMAESLNWDSNLPQEDEVKNSKDVLQELLGAMDMYHTAFSERNNMLDAQEEFCRVGKIIKRELPKNKINEETAKELMKPLQIMKNNMFDPRKQEEAYDAFKSIIIQELARENEKEGPEQSKEGQEQAREGVLSSAGTVLGRAITSTVKALKKINDKIEEGAKRAANEFDKEQATHAQQAQGAVPTEELAKQQRKEDVSQESEETLKHEDAAQKQQGPKTKEEALANLREALDKYNEDRNDLDKWRKYWAALHEPVLKDFAKKYFENGEKLQKSGAGEDELYKQAVEMIDKELGHDIKQEAKQQMQGAVPGKELGKKQEQKDLAPEMKRDTGAKEQQHEPQTKAEALQKLKELYANRYEARLNSKLNPGNLNRAFFAEMENNPMLKDVAKKYFDLYAQSIEGGIHRDGWFYYKAKEMINNELAKELGQEIQPEDKKISALLDVLYMSDSLQVDKAADKEAYDRMKSALQKLVDDKVISQEMMRDYQEIFDDEGRLHPTGAQVMKLENAILGQLDKLESENEKQQRQGKGKIVEPQQNVKEDPTQAQVKPEELIKAAEQQEKVDKKETILPGAQDKPRESELANKMQNKDVSPKPEDLMQREDLKQEKEPSEDMTAKKQEVLKKIENS
ncbi:MAG: hypothetical protein J5613_02115, partial [Alphaproteobacteria bacterium]|nr:hypothetical protein [Alphaproteobacteria bacterium]